MIWHHDEGVKKELAGCAFFEKHIAEEFSHSLRLEEAHLAPNTGSNEVGGCAGLSTMRDGQSVTSAAKAAHYNSTNMYR